MCKLRRSRGRSGLEDEGCDVVGERVADVAKETEAKGGNGAGDRRNGDLVVNKLAKGDINREIGNKRPIDLNDATKTRRGSHLSLILVVVEGTMIDRDLSGTVFINSIAVAVVLRGRAALRLKGRDDVDDTLFVVLGEEV